jgi:hypothetical protein
MVKGYTGPANRPIQPTPRKIHAMVSRFHKHLRLMLFVILSVTAKPQANSSAMIAPQGFWEAADQRGGAIGIDLSEATPEDGRATTQIGVYERLKAGFRCGDENFFDSKSRGVHDDTATVVSYAQGLLVIHFKDRSKRHDNSIDLDLTFNPNKDQWTGHFHRGSFEQQVILQRVTEHPAQLEPCILGQPGK